MRRHRKLATRRLPKCIGAAARRVRAARRGFELSGSLERHRANVQPTLSGLRETHLSHRPANHEESVPGAGRVADATGPSSRSLYCTLACQRLNEFEPGTGRQAGKWPRKAPKDTKKTGSDACCNIATPPILGGFLCFRGYFILKISSTLPRKTRRPRSTAADSLQPRSITKRSASSLARIRLYMANFGKTNSSL
jgi:hypothetical protein